MRREGPARVPVYTAIDIADVADEAIHLERAFSEEGEFPPQPWWDAIQFVETLINATWVPRLIGFAESQRINEGLDRAKPTFDHDPYSGEVRLITSGRRANLRDKIRSEHQNASEPGSEPTVSSFELFTRMIDEAIVDWLIQKSEIANYEIRICTWCNCAYEPQLRSRSRFCSQKCRKDFNNFRATSRKYTTFECMRCSKTHGMEDFSGLYDIPESPVDTATTARMSGYALTGDQRIRLLCARCVRAHFPEWRRYIAPLETLAERLGVEEPA